MEKQKRDREDLPEDAPIWAKRINQRLSDLDMTQEELAAKSGVSTATISGWIKGVKEEKSDGSTVKRVTEPKANGLIAVAKALSISIDYLLGETTAKSPKISVRAASEKFGLDGEILEMLARLSAVDDLEKGQYFLQREARISALQEDYLSVNMPLAGKRFEADEAIRQINFLERAYLDKYKSLEGFYITREESQIHEEFLRRRRTLAAINNILSCETGLEVINCVEQHKNATSEKITIQGPYGRDIEISDLGQAAQATIEAMGRYRDECKEDKTNGKRSKN